MHQYCTMVLKNVDANLVFFVPRYHISKKALQKQIIHNLQKHWMQLKCTCAFYSLFCLVSCVKLLFSCAIVIVVLPLFVQVHNIYPYKASQNSVTFAASPLCTTHKRESTFTVAWTLWKWIAEGMQSTGGCKQNSSKQRARGARGAVKKNKEKNANHTHAELHFQPGRLVVYKQKSSSLPAPAAWREGRAAKTTTSTWAGKAQAGAISFHARFVVCSIFASFFSLFT